jgi:hypothetical protein
MKAVVHTPFHLSRDDGTSVHYAVGEHDMPEADATHWWTAIHADVKKTKKAKAAADAGGENTGEESQP